MNKIRQQQLNTLLNSLYDFYTDCNIAPKCSEDLKKFWIIDKDESLKILAVMDLLADCGGLLDKEKTSLDLKV
jgi:hypothetical protein